MMKVSTHTHIKKANNKVTNSKSPIQLANHSKGSAKYAICQTQTNFSPRGREMASTLGRENSQRYPIKFEHKLVKKLRPRETNSGT